jgi:hypothetical protein
MSGAILHLVAGIGNIDRSIRNAQNNTTTIYNGRLSTNSTNFSHEPIQHNFTGSGNHRSCVIPRCGDLWKPEYIKIVHNDNNTNATIKKFHLEIGGALVFSCSLDFLEQIYPNTVSIRGNNKIYKINFDTFIQQHIPLVAIQYHEVKIQIELENTNNISEITLMSDYKFLDTHARREAAQNSHEYLMKQYCVDEQNFTNVDVASINMYNDNLSTCGIFIETESGIDNIKHLRLDFNNLNYRDLDDIQLDYLGQRISDNMIYLPFTPNQRFNDFNHHGSVNFYRLDTVRLQLTGFSPFNGKVKIHSMPFNVLRVMSGMGYVAYTNGHTGHYTSSTTPSTISSTTPARPTTPAVVDKIYTGEDTCVISMENIEIDALYMECDGCNKAFIKEYLEEWLNNSRTCPHCRVRWTSKQIYKNVGDGASTASSDVVIVDVPTDEDIINDEIQELVDYNTTEQQEDVSNTRNNSSYGFFNMFRRN